VRIYDHLRVVFSWQDCIIYPVSATPACPFGHWMLRDMATQN